MCFCYTQGLEGRSRNPVSVLVDSLIHPSNGQTSNDSSLLSWKRHPEKLIDHVVIGKGKPGGCWQVLTMLRDTLNYLKLILSNIDNSNFNNKKTFEEGVVVYLRLI